MFRRPLLVAGRRPIWTSCFLLLFGASLVYTYAGTTSRETYRQTWLPHGSVPWTLDGMAFMKTAYPGDYAGIQWLNAHVAGAQVVAEAPMCDVCAYSWVSRVAQFTGLPDIQNGIHEDEQRWASQLNRRDDITTLYTSNNIPAVWRVIHRYQVHYIFVGFLETHCTFAYGKQAICFPTSGIAKFQRMVGHGLTVAFHRPGISIYRVTG